MAKASFELVGLSSFVRDIQALTPEIRDRVAPVVKRTARQIERDAQARAPRDRGDLARAIQARGRDLSWRVGVVDQDLPARGGRNTAHRNPSVYAVWYEYGFVTRRILAHPFMGPARDAAEVTYESELARAVDGALT